MHVAPEEIMIEQGSPEWLNLRKTKITATDASIIMGVNHWKTPLQLYYEKTSLDIKPPYKNEKMQRGIDLEPLARGLFCAKTRHKMIPKVLVKDWTMASLDGINAWNEVLEIKCPGDKDHVLACAGIIPEHYYPQLQHQIYVAGAEKAFYFSFDGFDGVIVEVLRNDDYIAKMLVEEKKFYDCIVNKTPPEASEDDYIDRIEEPGWAILAIRWKELSEQLEQIIEDQENIRTQLIELCQGQNSKGLGIKMSHIQRRGNIDYSRIPELKNLDLEKYRKPSTTNWRITCQ